MKNDFEHDRRENFNEADEMLDLKMNVAALITFTCSSSKVPFLFGERSPAGSLDFGEDTPLLHRPCAESRNGVSLQVSPSPTRFDIRIWPHRSDLIGDALCVGFGIWAIATAHKPLRRPGVIVVSIMLAL